MATRSLFNNTSSTIEQSTLEDLITESIQIYGVDNYYLPQTLNDENTIFGEDSATSSYNIAYPLEMYVKNVDGFEGEGEFVSQFGIEIRDQVTFSVAVNRFSTEVNTTQQKLTINNTFTAGNILRDSGSPQKFGTVVQSAGDVTIVKNTSGTFIAGTVTDMQDSTTGTVSAVESISGITKTRENDLIWFSTTNQLWKIQYVEDESIFYQLGRLLIYDLQCELFESQGELVDTGVSLIDTFGQTIAKGTTFELNAGGSGTFTAGETVYQGVNFAGATMTALVKSFNSSAPNIELYNISAFPAGDAALKGNTSAANWTVNALTAAEVEEKEMEQTEADNFQIEETADDLIDFTESNPFGDF